MRAALFVSLIAVSLPAFAAQPYEEPITETLKHLPTLTAYSKADVGNWADEEGCRGRAIERCDAWNVGKTAELEAQGGLAVRSHSFSESEMNFLSQSKCTTHCSLDYIPAGQMDYGNASLYRFIRNLELTRQAFEFPGEDRCEFQPTAEDIAFPQKDSYGGLYSNYVKFKCNSGYALGLDLGVTTVIRNSEHRVIALRIPFSAQHDTYRGHIGVYLSRPGAFDAPVTYSINLRPVTTSYDSAEERYRIKLGAYVGEIPLLPAN